MCVYVHVCSASECLFEPDSVAILMEESEKGLTAPVEVEAPPVEEKLEEDF